MSHEGGERAKFSGHIGFVLAAAASAVGLGNLWRFPYLASHYGGGIFVLIYIIVAVTFGFSLMIAEIAIGRKTGKSCIHAFGDLARKYRWLGVVCAAIPIIIVAYYFVIGGWVAKWFIETAAGHLSDMSGYAGNYWWDYITGEISGLGDPMIWFFVFAGLCFVCVIRGVERGIERVSKVLMPALLVMIIGISAYNLIALDGIWDGVRFYLSPDVNELTGGTFLGAISQVFYSMSLAMGIMITYGSYMRKDVSIENSVRNISLIDTVVAIIAGLMIVPPAYIFGMGDEKGMGLMFEAMPDVFSGMPGGEVIAPIFYLLVLFAALTSAVSLLEAVVSVFSDARNRRRNRSIVLALIVLIPMGILVVLGFGPLMTDLSPFDQGAGILGIFDTLTNSIMMPIAAILTCVFIAVVIKTKAITDEVEAEGMHFRSKKLFEVMIKFVCPILLSFMLVLGLADMFGVFSVYRRGEASIIPDVSCVQYPASVSNGFIPSYRFKGMNDFDAQCKKLAEMDPQQFNQVFNEISVRVMEELSQVMVDGRDGLSAYMEFILASVAADGKLSEGEFKLLKPMFDQMKEKDVTYEEGVQIFKDMGLDDSAAYRKVIDTMVDLLGLISQEMKGDIILLCLLVCAIDGEVTEEEKKWILQLAAPLEVDLSAMEYIDVFLSQAGTFTLATVERNRPRMRVLGLKLNLDGRIYFGVGTFKEVYKQLKENPFCEILAFSEGKFLRWDGKAAFSDDPRLYPMLKEAMPEIAKAYFDNGWQFAFFTLQGGHAEIVAATGEKTKIF